MVTIGSLRFCLSRSWLELLSSVASALDFRSFLARTTSGTSLLDSAAGNHRSSWAMKSALVPLGRMNQPCSKGQDSHQ